MTKRTPRTALALAATALLLPVPLQAHAASSGRHGMKTVNAYTNWTEPVPALLPSTACPGPDCGFRTQGTTTFNGPGIFGTEDYVLYGGLPDPAHPGALEYHGTAVFHVTKSKCGTGTFTERVTDGVAYYSRFDAATQTTPYHNNWSIVPGSGTGQLVGITGSGTDDVDDATLTLAGATGDPEANKGVHNGTLTCRLH
jgi:hypothetical protein